MAPAFTLKAVTATLFKRTATELVAALQIESSFITKIDTNSFKYKKLLFWLQPKLLTEESFIQIEFNSSVISVDLGTS